MKNAFFRRGTALLCLLGFTLLAIAAFAVFGGERTKVDAYESRGAVLPVKTPFMTDGEINVNTAGMALLMQLPGVGESIASEMIKEREANGPFHFPEDLLSVKGIGEKKLEIMLPLIRLDEQP